MWSATTDYLIFQCRIYGLALSQVVASYPVLQSLHPILGIKGWGKSHDILITESIYTDYFCYNLKVKYSHKDTTSFAN